MPREETAAIFQCDLSGAEVMLSLVSAEGMLDPVLGKLEINLATIVSECAISLR